MSLVVHPDKLRNYPDATKVFQQVVNAFDRITKPEQYLDEPTGKKKAKSISRSNEGCYTTWLACPRCKEQWGTNLDGNPHWSYTIMMTGLKGYTCSTCLCTFGCMSALHKCPLCKKSVEYDVRNYHSKVTCCHCNKLYGYHL